MGTIRVSANGRYFVDQEGQPFFWLGDTQWELFRGVFPTDAAAILERRKQQGFTVFQIMLTGVGDGTDPNLAGQSPWIGDDPATPNEAYFQNVDAVVEQARQQGMILALGVFHQLQTARITPAKARAYAKWLAQRYRDVPNLVWSMYPKATPEYIPVLRELAAGLKEGDGGSHLITVHPDPSPASSSFLHAEPWLDFNSIQTYNPYERIDGMVRADYARTPVKPVVMAEGGYEGVKSNGLEMPLATRRQAYWTHLAGGHYSYGHDNNWVSPATWRDWIDSPGALHLGIYKQIVTGCRAWWDLIPDQTVFASGEGSGLTHNAAARSAGGDWVLAYLSHNAPVSLRMDRITAGGGAVNAVWIDPTTGEQTAIGTFANAGVTDFTPPASWQDAVLLLTA
ncbi:MAG TPA: glycoside hydrolase family 140 protein [Chthonomonadaceae bacterium]|nr:glycoside hydrolase family 140 protein [Chthonomonadaceae bacterium]